MSESLYNDLTWTLFVVFGCTGLFGFYVQYKFYKQLKQNHPKYFESIGRPTLWPVSWSDKVVSSVLDFKFLFKKFPSSVASDPIIARLTKWERRAMLAAVISWLVLVFFTSPHYKP